MVASGQRRTKTKSKAVAKPRRVRPLSARADGQHLPLPPKLTPPRPARLYPRTRLFDHLDRLREDHRVIWVSAPGGAGKTSLATSYLSTRKLPVLWYQVDQGDGDIASFFYYMGLAARQAAPRYKHPLPLLTPEYLADVPTFTRNFFRELYRRLPKDGVLVLDNYQDAPEDSLLHGVLHTAMGEVPEGLNLFVLSRVEPPSVLARLRLCDHAACLDWSKLQLTPEETRGIGALRLGKNLPDTNLDNLHQRTQGWAAGVVLMLEQGRSGATLDAATLPAEQKLLFDYFAGEILNRSEPTVREFLLKTALFPKFSADTARAFTDIDKSQDILDVLTRRNYFTVRHAGPDRDTYEYHPLFRQFLIQHAQETFPSAQIDALRTHAAALLEAAGDIEAAAELWRAASDWGALAAQALKHAAALAVQGRFQTLESWLRALPAEALERTPWLRYWLAVCRVLTNPLDAIPQFETAYAQFDRAGDVLGLYLAWAGAVDAIAFAMQDFSRFDVWLGRLEHLIEIHPEFPSMEVETRVIAAALNATMWRPAGRDAAVSHLVERATDLLHRCTNAAVTARLGFILYVYKVWADADDAEARSILDRLARLDKHLEGFPFERILTRHVWITHHGARGTPEAVLPALKDALEIAERSGVHTMDCMLVGLGVHACLGAGDLKNGGELLRRMEEMLRHTSAKLDHSFYWLLRAWHSALSGDFSAALQETGVAERFERELGAVPTYTLARLCTAEYQLAGGDPETAHATFSGFEAIPGLGHGLNRTYGRFLAADIALAFGNKAGARESVAQALRLTRRSGIVVGIGHLPALGAQTCAFALENGIEVETARMIIHRRRLAPPLDSSAVEQWPFPVKLYTLGRFDMVLDGQPLRIKGKVQRRPIDLLMALISLGGRAVNVSHLTDTLWPGTEADAAQAACKSALHRLRRLLGDDAALLLGDNQLSLNPGKVWVDAWAFERAAVRTETGKTSEADAERALALYHGPFLGGAAAPWAIPAREKLRAKFLRVLTSASRRHMQDGRHEAALRLIDRGLAAEPLAEAFYCDAMHCHAALGQRAEALLAYQRCHKLLASQLGIDPSPIIQALYRAVRDNQPLPP
jgi:ATP/maltotriose-dependent transcriptional regulator MalT/DNA-binding SARP family transcriptional activator